jgi:hypothetical protein
MSTVRLPAVNSYRVEVSGWDARQNFFLAKTDLHWREDNGKEIALPREVPDGAVLFVRLLHSTDLGRALPVPCHAEDLGSTAQGLYRFRLHPVLPKPREQSPGLY